MLSSRSTVGLVRNVQNVQILNLRSIQTTCVQNADPKKKKRTDATVIHLRIERKKRKFERLVAELEAQKKIKIPLLEYVVDKQILKNLDERTRKNTEKLSEIRNELEKLNQIWSLYKGLENRMDSQCLKQVMKTKLTTLKALRNVSPKLYENSLQLDETLFPFKDENVIKETVANKDFKPNDGQIINVTKVWKIEI